MTTPTIPNDDEQKKIEEMKQQFEAAQAPFSGSGPSAYVNLSARLYTRLAAHLGLNDKAKYDQTFEAVIGEDGIVLSRAERKRLYEQLKADLFGLGPLEAILADPEVTEVMVNGYNAVFIEKGGQLQEVPSTFRNNEHVLEIIQRIAEPMGRVLDESHPMVDMRLADGSRVNAIIPPIALTGPCLTIRKFFREPLTADDFLHFGSLDTKVLDFLRACVLGRANIIISGGTGAGKTALLNVLANFIPDGERIIIIESAAELGLHHRHVVSLESRPPNLEGRGAITIRDLVMNALRMRPDRLLMGEARGDETLDFLQALNSGHDGSMTTLHASNPRDALARWEVMAASSNPSIPLLGLREQMASAFNLIVHIERLMDGSRKIVRVTEVQGLQGDVVQLTDLFTFQQTGTEAKRVVGKHVATGKIPSFLHQLREAGIALPMEMFAPM